MQLTICTDRPLQVHPHVDKLAMSIPDPARYADKYTTGDHFISDGMTSPTPLKVGTLAFRRSSDERAANSLAICEPASYRLSSDMGMALIIPWALRCYCSKTRCKGQL